MTTMYLLQTLESIVNLPQQTSTPIEQYTIPSHPLATSVQTVGSYCSWCEFTGPTKDSLMYHMRLTHKMFNCAVCDFVGSTPPALEAHMSDAHNSKLCIYCGIDCGNARALKKHYSVDHGDKLKKCSQCSFTTSNKSQLTYHINREHHKRKPRSCPYCDYIAYGETQIKQHILAIHEKQRPFNCPKCFTKFGRKSHLKEHLKRRHQTEMAPLWWRSLGNENQLSEQTPTELPRSEDPSFLLTLSQTI